MHSERKPLDFATLDDFQPRKSVSNAHHTERKEIDKTAAFPSREQSDDSQINIKASTVTINRFRAMAKKDRYRHGEFLEILMDFYEKGK
ncbi:hypothetical protein [Bartonella sp. F02]|uniref:hypothetical protein n=1 Tax=Bartonella sp. F02 TaxID=2967262 RepID=UPI0022A9F4E0|nr:hypothetical protein [Bartonella sp. F02]MCZ2329030.1 hypothetical protein [Bartonella sp. F02]